MTELNDRIEGEIKSHEHEMLEKIRNEKIGKRKSLIQKLSYDWEKIIGSKSMALSCVKKSLEEQHLLLLKLLNYEKLSSNKLHIEREYEEITECLKEIEKLNNKS